MSRVELIQDLVDMTGYKSSFFAKFTDEQLEELWSNSEYA
jgi:hypothetical protein